MNPAGKQVHVHVQQQKVTLSKSLGIHIQKKKKKLYSKAADLPEWCSQILVVVEMTTFHEGLPH